MLPNLATPPRAAAWMKADEARRRVEREAAALAALKLNLRRAYWWCAVWAAALLLGWGAAVALEKRGLLPQPVEQVDAHHFIGS